MIRSHIIPRPLDLGDWEKNCYVCSDFIDNREPEKTAVMHDNLGKATHPPIHLDCLMTWMKKVSSCPTCREPLDLDQAEQLLHEFKKKKITTYQPSLQKVQRAYSRLSPIIYKESLALERKIQAYTGMLEASTAEEWEKSFPDRHWDKTDNDLQICAQQIMPFERMLRSHLNTFLPKGLTEKMCMRDLKEKSENEEKKSSALSQIDILERKCIVKKIRVDAAIDVVTMLFLMAVTVATQGMLKEFTEGDGISAVKYGGAAAMFAIITSIGSKAFFPNPQEAHILKKAKIKESLNANNLLIGAGTLASICSLTTGVVGACLSVFVSNRALFIEGTLLNQVLQKMQKITLNSMLPRLSASSAQCFLPPPEAYEEELDEEWLYPLRASAQDLT